MLSNPTYYGIWIVKEDAWVLDDGKLLYFPHRAIAAAHLRQVMGQPWDINEFVVKEFVDE